MALLWLTRGYVWFPLLYFCRCAGSVIERIIIFGGCARGIMIFLLIRVSGSLVLIVYSFHRFERDPRLHQGVGPNVLVGVQPWRVFIVDLVRGFITLESWLIITCVNWCQPLIGKRDVNRFVLFIIFFKMRWVSHQDGEFLWWFCTLNHCDQTASAYAVTCTHCLRPKGWQCSALRDYTCPGAYQWRPKLVRLYCYQCDKIHMPRELVNNRICWRQGISHRCRTLLNRTMLRQCRIKGCTVECTDYYKRKR